MNFKVNESEKKLQGSYYTPDWIADFVVRWLKNYSAHRVLEPSCGDGVFFDAIADHFSLDTMELVGFDTDPVAIDQCYQKFVPNRGSLTLYNEDFLAWAIENIKSDKPQHFDAIIGNPPFVRYQYMEKEQQKRAQEIFDLLGMKFTKHTNLWIPFVVASIEFLSPGGIIGMVVPSELLHVLYAQGLRDYLLTVCSKILLIDPEDLWFEDTLQGAMLLMAQKKLDSCDKSGVAIIRTKGPDFARQDPSALFTRAEYTPNEMLRKKWTYALLSSEELATYSKVCKSAVIFPFSKLATVDVGIVTGANKFFLVTDDIIRRFSLADVAHPMFGRSEHCPGVIYDETQHQENKLKGYPTNFLYFDQENDGEKYSDYLRIGIDAKIPERYKCRTRNPWYKVPSVFSSPICMLKRSNGMPRLILNRLGAFTTDTAYRVSPQKGVDSATLVFCFLNTVTALSAELEGRFYGGGVLELVPSEIERLAVPYIPGAGNGIDCLNLDIRAKDTQYLLDKQDRLIFSDVSDIEMKDILILRRALLKLQQRRQRIGSNE